MKKHIVIAWELGAALGHVMGFRALAIGLLAQNMKVSIVGRNLASVQQVLSELDVTFYQSPISLSERRERLTATYSYSDIIHDLGYESDQSLLGLTKGWSNLFELIKPDLVICDHSPTALLVCKCLDIQSCTFGNGFFLPPDTKGPVLFQQTDAITTQDVNQRYLTVVENINLVLKAYGRNSINVLYDLFRDSTHFLCTFSEIDHYQRSGDSEYYGPRNTTNTGITVPLKPSQKVVFAYLQPRTQLLVPLIKSLAKLSIKSVLFIPKAPAELASSIQESTNIELYDRPVNISKIFEQTALLINNASHGLVGEAILHGKPNLLLPYQLEQNILARKTSSQKLSIALNADSKIDIDSAIHFALNNKDLADRLNRVKQKYSHYLHEEAIASILDQCSRLLK
ncbi:hypothetical protein JAO78_015455 [Alishewanella sp. 16-MA]|uniref:Uncharacterized protein n=1 Tax=Alishewanella maricola TaxID=2795740 RepID=A0ABS8C7D2_9ALTE|nr:hypothetical protein [Alishewanella maricola]MCB5228206.1 hypothetical protein [Alishewanella maricola]